MNVIHIKDALRLLESGQPCNLKLWKLSTGDILEYKARYASAHTGDKDSIGFAFRHPA
jgi:hypothetical protein